MSINLIGLTGNAGSGKDTAAELLIKWGWDKIAFADPLKDICVKYLGLTYDDVYTQEGKAKYNEFWGMTNREILQKVGTDAFRNGFHKDTWIKIMELHLKECFAQNKKIIVCDCRFNNEAELIKKMGGLVFKVERNTESILLNKEQAHISEQGIDLNYIDDVIYNDKTIDDLHLTFKNILLKYQGQQDNE